ncbi:hypothetical protein MSAN_00282300 [Mycena sanguinolenta]|uniref:Uncharacterized protein n=1 Tax=Mycena sanguinolenta TaxID=230812 RepID=A0A8H7DFZ5_9AGAR|nr:hypothetical protein MSAN_00282300 [Mycena sanguinolenta]
MEEGVAGGEHSDRGLPSRYAPRTLAGCVDQDDGHTAVPRFDASRAASPLAVYPSSWWNMTDGPGRNVTMLLDDYFGAQHGLPTAWTKKLPRSASRYNSPLLRPLLPDETSPTPVRTGPHLPPAFTDTAVITVVEMLSISSPSYFFAKPWRSEVEKDAGNTNTMLV